MQVASLSPAADAFDAVAARFDERFGGWLSVAAQRAAVRAELLDAFPTGARVLEIGGGTGEDARWLLERGREVLLTDASPAMVSIAREKLRPFDAPEPIVAAAEDLDEIAFGAPFDGAFSNFAALNCVTELERVAHGLARVVRPGGHAILVVFGVWSIGEWIVQLVRGDRRAAFRRLTRGDVPARLGGREFTVRYHRANDLEHAFAPWFCLTATRGIGVFVPPSAAEPWISSHPRLLSVLSRLDRTFARPLAPLGDHVLYRFERLR
jgi:SAM-dependent methyltransferase